MMKFNNLLTVTIFSIGIVGVLTACDKANTNNKNTSTTSQSAVADTAIPNAPRYVMAVDSSYAPYAFKDEKGQMIGFDVDIIKAIGQKQGFNVDVIAQGTWSGVFDTLNNGTRDMVGSGVVATPERAASYELTNPILVSEKNAAYLGNRTDINSFDDLRNKTIGVQKGAAAYETALKTIFGENAQNVKPYKSTFLAFQDMTNGKLDAAFNDSNINAYYAKTLASKYNVTNIKFLKTPNSQPDQMVFVLKKGRTDLANKINDGLVKIRQDGTYNQIYKKWFGDVPQIQINPASASASTISTTASATSRIK